VIVEETNYLGRAEDVAMIAGIAEAIAAVNRLGVPVIVVSNQAGIGRGYYGWDGFQAVQARIDAHLSDAGAHIDLVMACAYHRDGREPYRADNHFWRKPSPGMLLKAAQLTGLDLSRSALIGDTLTDLQAAEAAGLRQASLVLTGHGRRQYAEHRATLSGWTQESSFSATVFPDAPEAIRSMTAALIATSSG
jgi:D-glycero-D-manno-heptose 1,7-bisphosphate phosphatase